ncbi:MAG: response regulator [Bdellovibrionales bacterium]|nr:response regulator [Bdellovibrionales bacterium]
MSWTVLVVDDDLDTRTLIQAMLQSMGHNVVLTEDGTQALEKLKTEEDVAAIDIIFLDLMMPGLSGYEVFEKLKSQPLTENIPVIMLTAKGSGEEMITGYQVGADYYIPKPFTKSQLKYGLELLLDTDGKARPDIPNDYGSL